MASEDARGSSRWPRGRRRRRRLPRRGRRPCPLEPVGPTSRRPRRSPARRRPVWRPGWHLPGRLLLRQAPQGGRRQVRERQGTAMGSPSRGRPPARPSYLSLALPTLFLSSIRQVDGSHRGLRYWGHLGTAGGRGDTCGGGTGGPGVRDFRTVQLRTRRGRGWGWGGPACARGDPSWSLIAWQVPLRTALSLVWVRGRGWMADTAADTAESAKLSGSVESAGSEPRAKEPRPRGCRSSSRGMTSTEDC